MDNNQLIRVVLLPDGTFDVSIRAPESDEEASALMQVAARISIEVSKLIRDKKLGCGHPVCMVERITQELGYLMRTELREDLERRRKQVATGIENVMERVFGGGGVFIVDEADLDRGTGEGSGLRDGEEEGEDEVRDETANTRGKKLH